MKQILSKSFFALALVLGMEQSANATVYTVLTGDMYFNPATIAAVHVGDTIKWKWVDGFHTTTSTTIPTGAATWDHNIGSANDSFMYVPTVVGTYNYQCTPHVSMGQVGSFVVTFATSIPGIASAPALTINPNPAKAQVSVRTDAKQVNVTLVDAAGRMVRNLELVSNSGSEKAFSLTGIAAGLYLMHIRADEMMVTEKLMVQE